MNKLSGKKMNLTNFRGCIHNKVKKSLKKTITHSVRARLNRLVKQEV